MYLKKLIVDKLDFNKILNIRFDYYENKIKKVQKKGRLNINVFKYFISNLNDINFYPDYIFFLMQI